jgi:hypothetical protein
MMTDTAHTLRRGPRAEGLPGQRYGCWPPLPPQDVPIELSRESRAGPTRGRLCSGVIPDMAHASVTAAQDAVRKFAEYR